MRIVIFLLVFHFFSDHLLLLLILWWLLKCTSFVFTWYFFCTLISLWTYLLYLWTVFVEKTWYALCASYIDRLYWCFVHPCISLLKCLFISHSFLSVEHVLICWFLLLLLNIFHVTSFIASFRFSMLSCTCLCSKISRREWGFHVMHTTMKCKSYLVHVPWGVPSYFL